MFEQVDDAISQLLTQCLAETEGGKVECSFAMPTAALEEKKSVPRLNLYLYGIQENTALRVHTLDISRPTQGELGSTRRGPVTVELKYLITSHCSDPKAEHRLLSEAFIALLRHPVMPEEYVPEDLASMGAKVEIVVAQPLEGKGSVSDLWMALNQPQRPAILLTVNLTVNPFESRKVRLVREFVLGMTQGIDRSGPNRAVSQRSIMISAAGLVSDSVTKEPLVGAIVEASDGQGSTTTDERGFFHLENLRAGKATLQVRNRAYGAKEIEISVPPAGRADLLEPIVVELAPLDDAVAAQQEIAGIYHEPGQTVTVEISGRLRLPDGSPAAYVPVRCGSSESVTDGEGFYVLRGVPGGANVVEAQMAGAGWTSVRESPKVSAKPRKP